MIEFLSYPFFQRALLAGALAALLCGALSFFVVLRRLAFVGSGVAHAAFGGVAVATLFGFPPLAGGLVAALLVAGATARAQGSSVSEDSAVGVFTVAAMALGVVALGFVKTNVDLFGLMFGNILTVAPVDLLILGAATAAVLAALAAFFRPLLLASVDEEGAQVAGVNTGAMRLLVLVLVGVAVVVALKVVGILLVSALLVLPGAAARPLAARSSRSWAGCFSRSRSTSRLGRRSSSSARGSSSRRSPSGGPAAGDCTVYAPRHMSTALKNKLVLVRHGESTWNLENRFTGWVDVGLSPKGVEEAHAAGKLLKAEGFAFDRCYSSLLKRAILTLQIVLEELDQLWLPVERSWRLNERHYGALQGLNKKETAQKYGEEQLFKWRRGYAITPPPLDANDAGHPRFDPRYAGMPPEILPATESLAIVVDRFLPYWYDAIVPRLARGEQVLVAAHGNSLRALVKHLDGISDEAIPELNIPTGIPLVYTLDAQFRKVDSRYLGDPEAAKKAAEAVAKQAKA